VDTRSAALSAVVTEETIQQLPLNGRNYIDLALLQPGVAVFNEKDSTASSNRGTKFNVNGMGFRSNSYLLDGAMRGYAGTATVSAAETMLGVETIGEFRVVTNAYSADLRARDGRRRQHRHQERHEPGARLPLRVLPRQLDGRAQLLRSPRQSAAVPAPSVRGIRRRAHPPQQDVFLRRRRAPAGRPRHDRGDDRAERGGALGAISPLIRPYLDLYPRPNGRQLSPQIAEYTYEINNPTRENFAQGRIDLTLTDDDTIFARYTYDGADQSVPVGFPDYGTDSVSRNQFFTVEHKRIVTSALLNTARFSHSRLRFEQLPVGPSTPELAFLPGQDVIGVITVPGLTNMGGAANNPSTNNSFYWTFSDDVSYAKGRHLIKTGVLIEHLRTGKLTATNIRGTYTFPNFAGFLAGRPNRFQGVLPSAQLDRVRPNTLFGFYLQDDVRTTERLTLNLGLRYEFYTIPADANGLDTALRNIFTDRDFTVGEPFASNPSLKNFAPRLGFAWDVAGDGRTFVRGGAGLYHDTDGPFNSAFGIASFSPPFAATTTITGPAFPQPSLTGGAVARTARTLDYNIKQPYGATYNVSVQRELMGGMVITVGYAGSRGYNLMSATEGNPNVPQILSRRDEGLPGRACAAQSGLGHDRLSHQRRPVLVQRAAGERSKAIQPQLPVPGRLHLRQGHRQHASATECRREQCLGVPAGSDRSRERSRSDGLRRPPHPDRQCCLGSARACRSPALRRLAAQRHRDAADRRAVHALARRDQLVAIGQPVRRRPGQAEPQAGRGSGRSHPRWAGPVLRSVGLRAAGAGAARQRRAQHPDGARLRDDESLAGQEPSAGFSGRQRPGPVQAGSVQSPQSSQLRRAHRVVFAAAAVNEAPLVTAGRIRRTVTSARQLQLGVKVLF
jgi:hypothetical protein